MASSCAVITPFSIWLGIGGVVGVLGAFIVACGLIAACFGATRLGSVQRCLDRHAARSARARREACREHALHHASGMRQQQYAALHKLVDDVERWDPTAARRFELEELLDYFVQLSVSHQRCMDSLHNLAGDIPLMTDNPRTRRRDEIAARRLRHHRACTAQLEQVADELDSIEELIRLVVQRVSCQKFAPELDSAVERRLAELDDLDEALTQLSA